MGCKLRPALTDADMEQIRIWEQQVMEVISMSTCPPVINRPICRSCAYRDLCYVDEVE